MAMAMMEDDEIKQWWQAVNNGSVEVVGRLLSANPNLINVTDLDVTAANTPLHRAALKGHVQMVAQLLAAKPALIDAVNSDGYTALHFAAQWGHDQVVTQLLEKSSKLLHASTQIGITALHLAAMYGRGGVVDQLLTADHSTIHAIDNYGWTVLYYAILYEPIAEMLLERKPEMIYALTDTHIGNTILHKAIQAHCRDEFVAKLWRLNPEALRALNRVKETPFHYVVAYGNDSLFGLFQWSLSLDEIVSACEACNKSYERLRPEMKVQCETLSTVLNQDVMGTVFEYLGLPLKRPAKKP